MTTYYITTCSESTNWKRVIIDQYDANNDLEALEAHYNKHHNGEQVLLRRAFLFRSMTINGTRYVAFSKQYLDNNLDS